MNRFYSLFFILLFFLINSCSNSSDTYNVMSFNIRLDVDSDGVNSWDNRKQEIVSIIKNQKIDILKNLRRGQICCGLQKKKMKLQGDFIEIYLIYQRILRRPWAKAA